jgi:hypothetical protein
MHIIIGMPPHIIIIGAPMAIMEFMASQRSFMRDIIAGSVGVIFIIMPSFVISQDILHIIGIMPLIIIGIIMPMPICPGIMPFIIMGIMPPIIGIMPFIIGMPLIMGIMPFVIGMPFELPIMPIWPIGMFIIGIWFMAFMVSSIASLRFPRDRTCGLGDSLRNVLVSSRGPQGPCSLRVRFPLP